MGGLGFWGTVKYPPTKTAFLIEHTVAEMPTSCMHDEAADIPFLAFDSVAVEKTFVVVS